MMRTHKSITAQPGHIDLDIQEFIQRKKDESLALKKLLRALEQAKKTARSKA
ncbi:MAG: hypothetical protein JW861_11450 [Bacteroidales bacterium]|nr:hypothetical protein [Bacteroidales bacterium]